MEKEHSLIFTFGIILGIVGCEAVAQFTLKKAAKENSIGSVDNKFFVRSICIAALFYTMITMLLLIAYKNQSLGHFNLMWSMGSILMAFLSGAYFFNEKIDSNTGISLIFAILSLFFAYK